MTREALPQYLYKFRTIDANSLSLLASDKLYLARVESFNDPFEFLNLGGTREAATSEDPTLKFAELEQSYRGDLTFASMRVCSLAGVSDDLLMWGHYTDCHKGFCIKFEFGNDPKIKSKLFPVHYEPCLPDCNVRINSGNDALRYGALTKCDKWNYECEWRIIGHVAEAKAHTSEFYMPYNSAAIVGIIFGLRMPALHKSLIRKVLQDHPHVKYYQAYKRHDSFALEIREIGTPVLPSSDGETNGQEKTPASEETGV